MYGDVITLGSTCGINGCQHVTITHKGGGDMEALAILSNDKDLDVETNLLNNAIKATTGIFNPETDVVVSPMCNDGIKTSFSLVCTTSQGMWEYLMVKEGEIVLIDGERVMVRRESRTN